MLTIVKSITGSCWHILLDGKLLDTACKKYEAEKLRKTYERKLKFMGMGVA